MTSTLSCVEANPDGPAKAAVIWLHGLGADGHDFAPIVPHLQAALTVATRFVFPHAPHRPVTVNGGYLTRAWYDIAALDLSQGEDADGIGASARQLESLIEREVHNGIAADHIVLAGFSQGGAVALHCGLRYPQHLAGILALSTYVPLAATVAAERSSVNGDIPIFMAHGSEDAVITLPHALASKALLQQLDYTVEWHSYPMAHSLCDQELEDIAAWLNRVLSD